jgi:hypothetical protein
MKKIRTIFILLFALAVIFVIWMFIYASGPVYQEPCKRDMDCYFKLGVSRMIKGYQTNCHPEGFCTITFPNGIAPVTED